MASGFRLSERRLQFRDGSRKALRYALPALFASVLVFIMNLINYLYIATFNDYTMLASYGIVSAYTTLAAGFFAPLATGAATVLEKAQKDNDPIRIQASINTSLISALVIGVGSTLIAVLIAGVYIRVVAAPSEIAVASTSFLRYFSITFIPILFFSVTTSILGKLGEYKSPMLAEFCATALHAAFCYIFVGLFDWGLKGCAVSAIIAQSAACMVNLHMLVQLTRQRNSRIPIKLDKAIFKEQFREEKVSILSALLAGIFAIFLQYFVDILGVRVVAAFALFFLFQDFLFIPINALRTPARYLSEEYYASGGNFALFNVVTPLIILSIAYSFLLIPVVQYIGPPLFVYFSHDPDVTIIGMKLLTLVSHYYAFYAASTLFSSALLGLGQARLSMNLNIIFNYLIRFVVLLGCALVIRGAESIVLCYPASWAISAGALVIYYYATYPILRQKKYSL